MGGAGNSQDRSEGFPLAAYFVPWRDGMGGWPNSKLVRPSAAEAEAASPVTNTSKTPKNSKKVSHHWALEQKL